MASADFSRREQARFCAVAHALKACGDLGKSQIDVTFDVLGKDGGGSHFVDDPLNIGPKVTRIVLAPPFPGQAERLAGITGSDDMNAAAPWSAVEGFKIVPDRRRLQGLVFHPRHESGRSMGFPLDETHSAVSRLGDGKAKVESGISGAERNTAEFASIAVGMNSHKVSLRRRLAGHSEEGSQASIG